MMRRSPMAKPSVPRLRRALVGTVAALTGMTMALTGCSSSGGGGSSTDQTFTIGAGVSLTGPAAALGPTFVNGAQIAVDYVNSSHLIKGQMRLKAVDTQALPGPAVTAIHQLIDVEHAVAVLSQASAPTAAMAPIAERGQVILMNPGSSSPSLAGLSPYLFNVNSLGSQQIPVMVPYAVNTLNLKKWAILYSTETLGSALYAALQKAVPAAGAEIVKVVTVAATDTTFPAQVAAIAAAKPDAVFFANTNGPTYPAFLNELAAAGVTATNLSYSGTDEALVTHPNKTAMIFSRQAQDLTLTDQATKALLAGMAPALPNTYQVNYFNAVLVVAQAIKDVQDRGQTVNGAALRGVIADTTFTCAGGTIAFTSDGVLKGPKIELVRVVDGQRTTVATVNS